MMIICDVMMTTVIITAAVVLRMTEMSVVLVVAVTMTFIQCCFSRWSRS